MPTTRSISARRTKRSPARERGGRMRSSPDGRTSTFMKIFSVVAIASGSDPERLEAASEVLEAARMVSAGLIEHAEHLEAAGSEEKVVTADRVLDDRPHRAAAIRIKNIAGGQVDGVRVVNRAARRQPLAAIIERERDEIRDLFALGIDDFEPFALFHDQSGTGLRFQMNATQKSHGTVLKANGAGTGSATGLPSYRGRHIVQPPTARRSPQGSD